MFLSSHGVNIVPIVCMLGGCVKYDCFCVGCVRDVCISLLGRWVGDGV